MDWDLGPDGDVILFPVTNYALDSASKMAVLMRVEFLWQTPEGEFDKGAVQLTLTPNEARKLAAEIQRTADDVQRQALSPTGGRD
jgi:hypothetical protein